MKGQRSYGVLYLHKYNNMELSKEERVLAREKIENYHRKKLAELFEYVLEKGSKYKQGKVDIFEMDHIVHIFHQQSQELFSFINTFYGRNGSLPMILDLIDKEEKGEWKWEPEVEQE